MRMRAAAGLDVRNVARVRTVGRVEHANAAHAALVVVTDRVLYPLLPAGRATVQRLTRDEQQVAVDGDIAVRAGADTGTPEHRMLDVRDVPDLDAREIALNDIVAAKREIGVDEVEVARVRLVEKGVRGRRGRYELQIPQGLARVEPTGLEADARIRRSRSACRCGRCVVR